MRITLKRLLYVMVVGGLVVTAYISHQSCLNLHPNSRQCTD